MLVTLVRAQVSFFEGFGLRGFVEVAQDQKTKTYSFRLPTSTEPRPPGWAWIEHLTKVTAQQVIDAWDQETQSNAAATAAVLELSSRFIGERFYASEVPNADGAGMAVELALLDTSEAAPKKITTEATAVRTAAVVKYSLPSNVRAEFPPGATAELLVTIGAADAPDAVVSFRVPDQNDRSPDEWWFVETFTGVSHERVANGWGERGGNQVLDDTVRLLAMAIEGHPVPLTSNGVDVSLWRTQLIQARMRRGIKPFIFLGRPDHNTEHTRAVFYDAAGKFLFRANVEPGASRGAPALIADADGKTALTHLDDLDVLRGILNRFIRFARSGRPPRPANPPKELLADIIRFPDRTWPIITGVVRIPTMRENGTIISEPGYDASTGLWFAPEFELEPIPDSPTFDDVQRARALIMTPLAEFPFVDEGARAGAVAALFEQVVRPMIRGPRPLYIFDAPEQGQGTGKTLLAKVIQTIIMGCVEPIITALGKREEEIEKRLTSLLRRQQPVVIGDNLTADVRSEALQQLATSERWQARLLNTNDAPIYPQTSTWILTLNAAKMNRDIARRSVLVRLDAKVAVAYERVDFKIEDVFAWSRDVRAKIIRACLVLVRDWVNAGRPADKEVVRGSFESWCKVIGGLLKHSGFKGLPYALKATSDRDINIEDHRLLVRCWLAAHPAGKPIPAITIGELAAGAGLYDEKLPKKANNLAVGKAMAKILRGILVGQVVDGYRVDLHPTLINGYSTYTLTPAADPPPGGERPKLELVK